MKISVSVTEAKYIADQLVAKIKRCREIYVEREIDKLKSAQKKKGWFSKELIRRFSDEEIERIMNDEMNLPWEYEHISSRADINRWFLNDEKTALALARAADTAHLSEDRVEFVTLDSEELKLMEDWKISINQLHLNLEPLNK